MGRAGFGLRVEGWHAVVAAAAAGRIATLHVESGRLGRPDMRSLVTGVEEAGGVVLVTSDVRPLADTTAPQGVVAECRPIPFATLENLVASSDPAAIVVLDRVVDPHNVGAIVRSSVAAGVKAFVVSDRRAAPLGTAAFKTAAGAFERVRVAMVSSIAQAVSRLSGLGMWTVGLDQGAPDSLFGLDLLASPTALVIGAEGEGLSRLVAERVDMRVSIPMAGPVESLNASVAAALAVFEMARVRTATVPRAPG